MKTHARCVVIGGGMMGAGLLYHLAQEGWTDILLIEKGELTSGSTWHAAGQCPSLIADYNMAKIHDYGNRLYPRLEELTGQYVSWHGCGGIRFARTPQEVEWFQHVAGVAKLIGFRMEIIDPEKIKQINPFVTTEGVLAGAWTLDDGHVDPAGCCNALAKGARDMGATIVRNNRVVDVKRRSSGEWEVVTEQGNVRCEHVVNAAGCYARRISRMVGTDVPITNMEHTYLVTEPIPAFIERDEEMVVMRDPYASAYYRQEQKAGLIGIYETENSQEAWSHRGGWPEWDSESELFEGDLDRIGPYVERVLERMPIWAEAGIKRIVCGAIPHTPDSNPLLGPAAGLRNFWQCCGSAIGIAQGAGCGKYLSQWMVHGDSEINMAGLDPRRFGRHAPGGYTKAKACQDYEHMYALHLPGEERPAARKARVTPLYDKLTARGAVHTEANGWERPKWFSLDGRAEAPGFRHNNVLEVVAGECRAVRERVGVLDLSSFAKFDVTGADAEAYLNRICANRMARREGGIALAHFLTQEGRIAGEATITRLGEGRFYVLSGAAAENADLDHLSQRIEAGEDVNVTNITDDWGVLVLAGPRARDLLVKLTGADLSNQGFRWLTGKEIEIAGVALRALRVNYVGELGWELHCPMARLAELYDAIWDAGREFDIANFGVYAVNSLRIEKAYKGWGAELTNEITMVEADMERFVGYDKEDFVGKAATLKVKQAGGTTQLVYFEVAAGDCDVHGGEPVIAGGRVVGVTTSGGYGHATGKSLGFAYVEPGLAAPGSAFEIDLLGTPRAAKVLAEPAYDPKNERLRA
ncbi:MAG: GcvT family protein [Proteobacteria bacterium]|nr:GcvT family protein [Pseudomonadota bacterium]